MLEDAINNLSQAINALTAELQKSKSTEAVHFEAPKSDASAASTTPAKPEKAAAKPEKAPAKPGKAATPAKPEKAAAPEPKEPSLDDLLGDDGEDEKEEMKPVTNEDVQALCFSMIRKDREKYRKAIKDTITSFGVDTIDKLNEEQLRDCFLKLTELANAK